MPAESRHVKSKQTCNSPDLFSLRKHQQYGGSHDQQNDSRRFPVFVDSLVVHLKDSTQIIRHGGDFLGRQFAVFTAYNVVI